MKDIWFALRLMVAVWALLLFTKFWPAGNRTSANAVLALIFEIEEQRRLLRGRLGLKP